MSAYDAYLSVVVAPLAKETLQFVVPLFNLAPGKRPAAVGTGFFVSAHGNSYLISAAHVLDYVTQPGSLHYYIDSKTLKKVSGKILSSVPPIGGSRKSDRIDIGVARLAEPRLPPYPEIEKDLLPLSALSGNVLPKTKKHYFVVGFPASKSRPNPRDRVLSSMASGFSAVSEPDHAYVRLGVSQQSNVVLSVDVARMTGLGGKVQAIANPHGMSGSPVFLIYDEAEPKIGGPLSVVGVVIEHHQNSKAIVASDIGYAIYLINNAI